MRGSQALKDKGELVLNKINTQRTIFFKDHISIESNLFVFYISTSTCVCVCVTHTHVNVGSH